MFLTTSTYLIKPMTSSLYQFWEKALSKSEEMKPRKIIQFEIIEFVLSLSDHITQSLLSAHLFLITGWLIAIRSPLEHAPVLKSVSKFLNRSNKFWWPFYSYFKNSLGTFLKMTWWHQVGVLLLKNCSNILLKRYITYDLAHRC